MSNFFSKTLLLRVDPAAVGNFVFPYNSYTYWLDKIAQIISIR